MPSRKKGVIYLGDVKEGKKTFKQYMKNCYERNKDVECHREQNPFPLCKGCPKAKEKVKKDGKKTPNIRKQKTK